MACQVLHLDALTNDDYDPAPNWFPVKFDPRHRLMALSWKQPYGELMLHDKIETRTWHTKYRGWVLMCASKQPYTWHDVRRIAGQNQYRRIREAICDDGHEFTTGKAFAIGWLDQCRPMTKEDEDRTFVEYQPPSGSRKPLFCHIYRNVQGFEPFDWVGTQGWKECASGTKEWVASLLNV